MARGIIHFERVPTAELMMSGVKRHCHSDNSLRAKRSVEIRPEAGKTDEPAPEHRAGLPYAMPRGEMSDDLIRIGLNDGKIGRECSKAFGHGDGRWAGIWFPSELPRPDQ